MMMNSWCLIVRNLRVSFFLYQGLWLIIICEFALPPTSAHTNIFGEASARTLRKRSLPGYCPDYWYSFGNNCYKVFGESSTSEDKSWFNAEKHCRQLGSNLTSIHSEKEQDFLQVLVFDIGRPTWIGLHRRRSNASTPNNFEWDDNSPVNFTNWEVHPNLEQVDQDCVRAMFEHFEFGIWITESCQGINPYICQKPKDPTLTKPGIDPSLCTEPAGWAKIKNACYKVIYESESKGTWLQADSFCKQRSGNLASVKNPSVTIHLHRYLHGQQGPFWIGVKSTEEDMYRWLGKYPLFYTNWGRHQPAEIPGKINCVAVDTEGKWMVKDCEEIHPFICEAGEVPEHPTIAPHQKDMVCPDTSPKWNDFGGTHCYLIEVNEKVPWEEASRRCLKEGGFLASFHSMEEINAIVHHHKDLNIALHMGLSTDSDGAYLWADGSPVDFFHWGVGEPNWDWENCTEIQPDSTWADIPCELLKGYVCSILKGH